MTRFVLTALFLIILLLSALPAHAEGEWWWCGTVPCSSETDAKIWLPVVSR